MTHRQPDSKILFDLPEDEESSYREESLHAASLGNDLYEVLNVPLLALGLNLHDIVRCVASDGLLRIAEVVAPSGFGTAHLVTAGSVSAASRAALIEAVRSLGCIVEQGFGIYGVAVPPEVDRSSIGAILDAAYARGDLTYEAQWWGTQAAEQQDAADEAWPGWSFAADIGVGQTGGGIALEMRDVYRRFINGELALEEAAEILQTHASSWHTKADSLNLYALPDGEREKAATLFNAAIQPILAPYFAGWVASDITARQLAPLASPLGTYALNLNMPTGPRADEAMARLVELMKRLADLESEIGE